MIAAVRPQCYHADLMYQASAQHLLCRGIPPEPSRSGHVHGSVYGQFLGGLAFTHISTDPQRIPGIGGVYLVRDTQRGRAHPGLSLCSGDTTENPG